MITGLLDKGKQKSPRDSKVTGYIVGLLHGNNERQITVWPLIWNAFDETFGDDLTMALFKSYIAEL